MDDTDVRGRGSHRMAFSVWSMAGSGIGFPGQPVLDVSVYDTCVRATGVHGRSLPAALCIL